MKYVVGITVSVESKPESSTDEQISTTYPRTLDAITIQRSLTLTEAAEVSAAAIEKIEEIINNG